MYAARKKSFGQSAQLLTFHLPENSHDHKSEREEKNASNDQTRAFNSQGSLRVSSFPSSFFFFSFFLFNDLMDETFCEPYMARSAIVAQISLIPRTCILSLPDLSPPVAFMPAGEAPSTCKPTSTSRCW